jgi:hypothetical protein
MASKRVNPPAATGGSGRRDRRAAKFHNPENNPLPTQMQDFRTAWLARRFNLSLAMAEAIAESAFSVGGAH